MIRIKDVAKRAGVSPTTVSNVIHGKEKRVSKENLDKINRIIKEMNYVPSLGARMLANEKSNIIGVVLGYEKRGIINSMQDPFVGAFIGNLEYEIRRNGYYMMIVSGENEEEIINQAIGWNVDGLIALGFQSGGMVSLSKRFQRPFVSIDVYYEKNYGIANIQTEDFKGGYIMGNYLLTKGHREILFLADNDKGVDHYRWLGFEKALQENKIQETYKKHRIISSDSEVRKSQYHDLLSLVRKYTAIFCASDFYAVEISNYLQDKGVQIPKEISIAGFDDLSYAQIVRPKLTTIKQRVDVKAQLAVEAIFNQIDGGQSMKDFTVPVELVERDSVREL